MQEGILEIKKVGVVGCGLMGSGIAEVSARAGFDTVVLEVDEQRLERGLALTHRSMETAVSRGKLPADQRDRAIAHLRGTTSYDDLGDRDVVIEAVIEDLAEKRKVFACLDTVTRPEAILATNTSSIPVIRIATATKRSEKVIGTHFMNPVPVLPLVEVVRTVTTSDATLAATKTFCTALGKRVIVSKDRAGFIVNLLLIPYLLNSISAVEDGVASREDIDIAMRLGTNMPMGPLTLADFVGLDTLLDVADVMYREFLDVRYAPPPLLRQMVAAGFSGRKTSRGFYNYAAGEEPPK